MTTETRFLRVALRRVSTRRLRDIAECGPSEQRRIARRMLLARAYPVR